MLTALCYIRVTRHDMSDRMQNEQTTFIKAQYNKNATKSQRNDPFIYNMTKHDANYIQLTAV